MGRLAGSRVLVEGGRMRIRGVVMVAVVGLSACSGGGSSDALNLGTTVVATSPVTAAEVSTTVAAAVVAASTSVVVETTLPATTAVETTIPVTTVPEPASKEDQVKADYQAARMAREHCTYDPASCDYSAIAVPGSPMDVRTHEVVEKRAANNLRAVAGQGGVQLRVETVGFEGSSAFVTICAFDTVVIYDIADPVNSDDDIVFNDEVGSYRVRWEMRMVDDRWLLYSGITVQELTGADLCEF